MPIEKKQSLLGYYQEHEVNPVLIRVEDDREWKTHVRRRRNLYTNHLMIPPVSFKGAAVLEFGCNSGENALFLASLGARLTLVEPNHKVLPRLKDLFKRFGFEDRIDRIENRTIEAFDSEEAFDVVIVEGFLHTLASRDELLSKICGLLRPGGVGVISYDDLYGSLIELIRVMLLHQICRLKKISELHSQSAYGIAQALFEEDFNRINASRSFQSWWMDNLVNPFTASEYFWRYQDIIPIIEKRECCFHSCSPKWTDFDNYSWYKNVPSIRQRHLSLLEDWNRKFVFFLTGIPLSDRTIPSASREVVDSVSQLIQNISRFISHRGDSPESICFPAELVDYLYNTGSGKIQRFGKSLQHLFRSLQTADADQLMDEYQALHDIRNLWGSALNYICFTKLDAI